jgi:hypothetical protein
LQRNVTTATGIVDVGTTCTASSGTLNNYIAAIPAISGNGIARTIGI